MGRGTVRRRVEGRTSRLLPIADGEGDHAQRGGGVLTALHSLPLHHPSPLAPDGPPPHSLREQGGDGKHRYPSADCQHIPSSQPFDSAHFPKITASSAIMAGTAPIIVPVPSHGRLARPAIRSGGGSGWSGISLRKQGGRTGSGDLLRVGRPGWRTGGDTQVVPGIGTSPDLPAGGAAVRR